MLFGSAPAAGVAGADAVGENTFLSPSFSVLFSISIEPLKYAPSSMMICAVVKSPFTEPSFLISILPFPRTLPFTLPYTITSPAMTSAVNFAVAPIVTFRSSSWTSPSTVPSMYRSSLPEISPFTYKLDPSRAVAPAGCITSLFILGVPSQDVGAGFWRLIHLHIFGLRVPSLRRFRFLVTPHRTSLGTGAQLTHRVGAATFQVSSLIR